MRIPKLFANAYPYSNYRGCYLKTSAWETPIPAAFGNGRLGHRVATGLNMERFGPSTLLARIPITEAQRDVPKIEQSASKAEAQPHKVLWEAL